MERIYFPNKRERVEFFSKIKRPQVSWGNISKIIGTSRSMLEKYRDGKLNIPEDRFTQLLSLLQEKERRYFLNRIEKKPSNWGQIIGGKNAYKVNIEKFKEGRKKGAKARRDCLKYFFDSNMNLSEDLCEFLGAIIGDGFTSKYNSSYITQISGDKNLDKEYYYKKLKPICENLFNISPKIAERPSGITLSIYSKKTI